MNADTANAASVVELGPVPQAQSTAADTATNVSTLTNNVTTVVTSSTSSPDAETNAEQQQQPWSAAGATEEAIPPPNHAEPAPQSGTRAENVSVSQDTFEVSDLATSQLLDVSALDNSAFTKSAVDCQLGQVIDEFVKSDGCRQFCESLDDQIAAEKATTDEIEQADSAHPAEELDAKGQTPKRIEAALEVDHQPAPQNESDDGEPSVALDSKDTNGQQETPESQAPLQEPEPERAPREPESTAPLLDSGTKETLLELESRKSPQEPGPEDPPPKSEPEEPSQKHKPEEPPQELELDEPPQEPEPDEPPQEPEPEEPPQKPESEEPAPKPEPEEPPPKLEPEEPSQKPESTAPLQDSEAKETSLEPESKESPQEPELKKLSPEPETEEPLQKPELEEPPQEPDSEAPSQKPEPKSLELELKQASSEPDTTGTLQEPESENSSEEPRAEEPLSEPELKNSIEEPELNESSQEPPPVKIPQDKTGLDNPPPELKKSFLEPQSDAEPKDSPSRPKSGRSLRKQEKLPPEPVPEPEARASRSRASKRLAEVAASKAVAEARKATPDIKPEPSGSVRKSGKRKRSEDDEPTTTKGRETPEPGKAKKVLTKEPEEQHSDEPVIKKPMTARNLQSRRTISTISHQAPVKASATDSKSRGSLAPPSKSQRGLAAQVASSGLDEPKEHVCHDCGYATNRINNIVIHKKSLCSYSMQQYQAQVQEWRLKLQQSPKSNSKRSVR